MQTRVGRHNYQEEILDIGGRTKKNADLYKKDYKDEEIKVPKISNGRELNEAEFQKIINQSQTRSMKTITKDELKEIEEPITKGEDKVYDINSVLEKAKNRRKTASKTQYKVPSFEEYITMEEQEIKDDMELLSDLMGDGNTVVTPKLVEDTIIEENINDTQTQTQIDDSFYSKSIKFERKDFDDNSFHEKTKKHSKLQIVITIIVVILLIVAVILGILILSKFKF